MKKSIKYLSLCGMLGYGYAPLSLENALQHELDFIGVDAGSTDPGPYYLGSGKGFVKYLQVKRDLSLVLKHIKERHHTNVNDSSTDCNFISMLRYLLQTACPICPLSIYSGKSIEIFF